jgi:hypothetical protein
MRYVQHFGRNTRLKKPQGEARRWRNMMRIHTELNDLNMGSGGGVGCEYGNEFVDSIKAGKFFNQNNLQNFPLPHLKFTNMLCDRTT